MIGDKNYHNKGIGSKVVTTLINRARDLDFKELYVEEIYDWNIGSIKLFTGLGFKKYKKTNKGYSYKLLL
ncbi:GNAT family N-acetyltransferase [Gemelliphila palaticanis]|uniref:GNAT family N-acetyltransferase n=1 Tax=Gemelliphila palaticanis TaxID=81950 RepID=A0ABX2T4I1_9BACL|nr:GNAT family N-acetyltransferase [Gemella palaticanis]MBF0716200.1 GNAT family N-acetyltransferase [Gemella palaticanis]NYS48130.1 GNAT family N-acetyltransferase [Gemella palaticanis]